MKLPEKFVENIHHQLGSEAEAFLAALSTEPQVSVRLNTKSHIDAAKLDRVPWCDKGFYLDTRPQFTFDPLFHAGCYYVQEASSMFLFQALKQYVSPDAIVADLCAAPGGKSTLIADYLSDKGLLVSNEFVPQRANILTENIQKWGAPNCVVSTGSVSHFEKLPSLFDAIVVDAPCSGEGMFRKDDKAIEDWSEDNVALCVERQRDILRSAWQALKTDGVLIYSTCTYNTHENEENVQWLIDEYDAEYLSLDIDSEWGIATTERGYHFYPYLTRGEGLFLAVVRKRVDTSSPLRIKAPRRPSPSDDTPLQWLANGHDFKTIVDDNHIVALPAIHYNLLLAMRDQLKVLHMGIPLAEVKGRNLIPLQPLAISTALSHDAFPRYEVDLETALTYLRAEAIITPNAPKGIVLITYHDVPLGFVKNLGNRANNLYSDFWRIRSAIPSPLPSQFWVEE